MFRIIKVDSVWLFFILISREWHLRSHITFVMMIKSHYHLINYFLFFFILNDLETYHANLIISYLVHWCVLSYKIVEWLNNN